jgi:hypothetical protein
VCGHFHVRVCAFFGAWSRLPGLLLAKTSVARLPPTQCIQWRVPPSGKSIRV